MIYSMFYKPGNNYKCTYKMKMANKQTVIHWNIYVKEVSKQNKKSRLHQDSHVT